MNLKPLNDNLIVKRLSVEKKKESGIMLPENVKEEQPNQGEVIAVGPGKLFKDEDGSYIRRDMEVKVGDVVIFKRYSSDEIKVDEQDYLFMTEGDVIGVVGNN